MINHAFVRVAGVVAIVSIPFMAWADEVCELRNTTAKERALYDWVASDFPRLVHTSSDYVRVESNVGVDRNSICGGEREPLFVNSDVSFMLDGQALTTSQQQMQVLNEEGMAVVAKMQENIKAGMSVMAASNIMEPEIQRIDRERAVIEARERIRVQTEFNSRSAECQGEKVAVAGAVAACRLDNEDNTTQLVVLFGAWKKGDAGAYDAAFDHALPSHRMQTIAISIVAGGEALEGAMQQTDWATIHGRIQQE
jgi:hypothetical protein